ncbi:MAG: hypothetical protein HYR84_01510 [Planctomycetes bacterium]|nr:hypothetical protein [Planctomycetota bacterium]
MRFAPPRRGGPGGGMFDISDPACTLLFILIPLVLTFIGQRLYLHFVNVHTDLFVFGHNVHHLFVGVLMAMPAAFTLAFQPETPWLRLGALAVLGSGTSMVLDEVVFLIATDGANESYLKPVSLWGAVVLHGLAVALLLLLFFLS